MSPDKLNKPLFFKQAAAAVIMLLLLMAGAAWGATVVPPVALVPLNQIAVPEPSNLYQFVKNKPAAIRLGKALFWDMQVGSDGMTACATCHFSAGTDKRTKNTLHPGRDGIFNVRPGGPNQTVQQSDFPFHQRDLPEIQASQILRDSDDAVGSQGVRLKQFVNIVLGSRFDNGVNIPDPIFILDGFNTRAVTGRNTPSVINAAFNFTNFWDGRASAFFNGVNPFGPLDTTAGVWFNVNGALVKQPVSIEFASLASQATGPPLSEVEMSFKGRTFPQLGRKMLNLTPLGVQFVHPDDSVLGAHSRASLQPDGTLIGSKGLDTTYRQMIKDAFHNNLWNSNLTTDGDLSQIEANFSLFWGLAIQLYEATLIADDTPFDRFLGGDETALTPEQQDGFNIFFGVGRCDVCHAGTEQSNASFRAAAFIDNLTHGLMEVMPVTSGKQIIYDNGFNNTAVTRINDDIGRGADSPFLNLSTLDDLEDLIPLSFSLQAELQAAIPSLLPFAAPILPANVPADFPVANNGAFKVPSLRNVELTAPYMHNGSMGTLDEMVDFYTRGGNFPGNNKSQLDINIAEIPAMQNEPEVHAAMVAFMMSMTDERVRRESAPFDHPEIFVPNGDSVNDADQLHLPATGIVGKPAVTLNPVTTPTSQANQLISGTKVAGTVVEIMVNNGQIVPADTTTDTTWSTTVTGLVSGSNTIDVIGTDPAGGITILTTNILYNATGLTITAGAGPNGSITPPGNTIVAAGADQSYTITPDAGFMVTNLVVDGTLLPGATSYTFTGVSAPHYINAYFGPAPANNTITAGAGPNGSITPPGNTIVATGTDQSYTITPDAGFMVTNLVVDGTLLPGATSYTFTGVSAPHYINAYFGPAPANNTITAGAGPNGSITPPGNTIVAAGADQSYTITPDAGFMVTNLVVDGTLLPGATSYTFTGVSAPHYINAYFGPAPANFTVTAGAGPNGSITPPGNTIVATGTDQSYTITPDAGFTVTALVVDGVLLPGATSYTFTGVSAPHYINAYFAP